MADQDPKTDAREVRQRILNAAAALFAAEGYHQTSTREIALAARIDQPALFHHFASKAEIMNTILKHDLGAAVEAAEHQLRSDSSPALRLYRYLAQDVGMACRSPYAVGINGTARLLKELDFAGARARSQRLTDARVAMIQQGIGAGEFVDVDPHSASRAIEWTIEGSLADIGTAGVDDPEAAAREVAGLCLRALLVDPSQLEEIRQRAAAEGGAE